MHYKIVILWTDALIYLLAAATIIFVVWARKREHLTSSWRQILRNRLGVASLIILLFYITIGLLDSLHFREVLTTTANNATANYSAEVKSLLDYLLSPLGEHYEQTFSRPFATTLAVTETIKNSNGTISRIYPRLLYGGTHLKDPQHELLTDVLKRSGQGFIIGIICWLIISAFLIFFSSWRTKIKFLQQIWLILTGKTTWAWQTFLITLLVSLVIVAVSYNLSQVYHIFGTDKVGHDVFYEAIKGIRTGLIIGTLTTIIMLPFAVTLGMMAGYFGGWVDDVIQYGYTTLSSIPGVLLIAAAILALQAFIFNHAEIFPTLASRADMRLLALCAILGMTSWTGLCRMLRGETYKLREADYIQAARALGSRHRKILFHHVLPNVMHIILIAIVLDFSALVLAEAVLSYVGVGVDPTTPSWGNMINAARLQLARDPVVWWPLLASFIFMFVLVLAANLFSDAVRDAFDPRIRK